ncbi:hypothetical protein L211DRAFT_512030 [Terfezia boudieri ATCC MYA-4762]|uniref:Uncharacterized protein n=1 Tax=Terfezia boudieri ATCC MYA-4762 TaxID=1051890 RepID=A0A3N4LCN6_9PEZI|nr:hypothetical protein L211DRAFT_512030 [Terfezia boudieri ATCC MYA-4762]
MWSWCWLMLAFAIPKNIIHYCPSHSFPRLQDYLWSTFVYNLGNSCFFAFCFNLTWVGFAFLLSEVRRLLFAAICPLI